MPRGKPVGTGLAETERLLDRLAEEFLSAWDQDFVEDMQTRVETYGEETFISARQWEQLQRMKEQYL